MSYSSEVLADSPLWYAHLDDAGYSISAITASSNYSANPPAYAHEGDTAQPWITNAVQTGWVQYQLSTAFVATGYAIWGGAAPTRNPKSWTFEGSNNGSSWTTLDTQTNQSWSASGVVNRYPFTNSTAYLYYRLNVSANNGDTYLAVAEMILTSDIVDSSGNGRTMINHALTSTTGQQGNGLKGRSPFAVTGGLIPAASWMNTSTWTVEAWVNRGSGTGARLLTRELGPGQNISTDYVWSLRLNLSNQPEVVVFRSGSAVFVTSATAASASTWYHLAATWDGTTVTLYVNGSSVATATPGGAISATAITDMVLLNARASTSVDFAYGVSTQAADEAAFYGSALSSARILAHYTAGTAGPSIDITTPKATSTSAAPAPTMLMSLAYAAPKATASALALAAALTFGAAPLHFDPPPADSTAAAPAPTLVAGPFGFTPPEATAASAAPAPSFAFGTFEVAPPKATATATAPAPSLNIAGSPLEIDTPPATGSGLAPPPSLSIPIPPVADDVDDATALDLDTDGGIAEFTPPLDTDVPIPFIQRPIMRRSVIVPNLKDVPGVYIDPITQQPHIPDDVYDAFEVIEEEVGIPHVIFPDIGSANDMTFYRGGRTQILSDRREDPFGEAVAQFEFPIITSMDDDPTSVGSLHPWMQTGANCEIVVRKSDGAIRRAWSGNTQERSVGNQGARPFYRLTAIGSLRGQAADEIQKPINHQDPLDYGYVIARAFNSVTSARFAHFDNVTTGMKTKNRGAWSDNPLGFVQNCLSKMWDATGIAWTVAKVEGTRRRYLLRKRKTEPEWTFTNGARGVSVDLKVDASGRNVIYIHGVTEEGGYWGNYRYGVQSAPEGAPEFPMATGVMTIGTTDAGTTSGEGVTVWQRQAAFFGYPVTIDGVYDEEDAEAALGIQRRRGGLGLSGDVGPATWAAMFGTAGTRGNLLDVTRVPGATDPRTQEFLLNADGTAFAPNPDYTVNRQVRADDVDMEQNTRAIGARAAQQIVEREKDPCYVGRITVRTDPREGSRMFIAPGDKMTLIGYEGRDVVLHITAIDRSWQAPYEVTLEVDERSRDAMTVAQIRVRDREARRDPARRPGNPNLRSRLEQPIVPFDWESPAGRIPRHQVTGGVWTITPRPFGTAGRIAKVHYDTGAPMSVGVFARPITRAHLDALVGNPWIADNPLKAHQKQLEQEFGLVAFWGQKGQRMGYSPGLEQDDDPFTGDFDEGSGFDYVSSRGPWLWVAEYTAVTTSVSGRFYPAPVI